jgi:hypothetical protein
MKKQALKTRPVDCCYSNFNSLGIHVNFCTPFSLYNKQKGVTLTDRYFYPMIVKSSFSGRLHFLGLLI